MPVFRANGALLKDFREGRLDALEKVYRTYVRTIDHQLRALARTHACPELRQPSAVADLIQEVFVRAFSPEARQAYDGLRDYGPYLGTIARNFFIDTIRKRGRERLFEFEEELVEREAPQPTGDVEYDPRILDVLTVYLAGLPPREMGVYKERFVSGRSQEEAAAALGISRRKLRTAETRLRDGLRKALHKAGISLSELGAYTYPQSVPLSNGAAAASNGSRI